MVTVLAERQYAELLGRLDRLEALERRVGELEEELELLRGLVVGSGES